MSQSVSSSKMRARQKIRFAILFCCVFPLAMAWGVLTFGGAVFSLGMFFSLAQDVARQGNPWPGVIAGTSWV